jgi:hypothetical protein
LEITTCDKPQKEKPNLKKNQTNKQTIQGTYIHVFGERTRKDYFLVGDDDGQRKQPFHGS